MRGKYKNAAEKRRAEESLEARTANAEKALADKDRELEKLRTHNSQEIANLKQRLRDTEIERDANSTRAVEELLKRIEDYRTRLDASREETQSVLKTHRSMMDAVAQLFRQVSGCTHREAFELIARLARLKEGDNDVITTDVQTRMKNSAAARRIETARTVNGQRIRTSRNLLVEFLGENISQAEFLGENISPE